MVFWSLNQIQYKNPHTQILTFKDMTPSPFISFILGKLHFILILCNTCKIHKKLCCYKMLNTVQCCMKYINILCCSLCVMFCVVFFQCFITYILITLL